MPELPEVETVVRSLRDGHPRNIPSPDQNTERKIADHAPTYDTGPNRSLSIVGAVITRAQLLWNRTLAQPSEPEFYDRIIGQQIKDITRRAKYLVFHLSTDQLLVHLRMSGDLLLESIDQPIAPHDRLVLHLENPAWDFPLRLAFNDTRKFGRIWLVSDSSEILGHLGPEPLSPDFTAELLHEMLSSRQRQLKPLLLDQSFIAGLGNIYTDEALHRAGLHPLTIANTVSQAQATALWEAIRHALQEGIRHNGASIDWMYRGGEFQNNFMAYGRTDEPCYTCGTPIRRIVVGQRGTHFCPSCQPTPSV